MSFSSIPARFFAWREDAPSSVAYGYAGHDGWVTQTWSEYVGQVEQAAVSLLAMGITKGDRVAILGSNRPEWTILDMACMAIGAVSVGIYASNATPQVEYVVKHSEAGILFVDSEIQLEKARQIVDRGLKGLKIIGMTDAFPTDLTWSEFIQTGSVANSEKVAEIMDDLHPEDLATLVYTSGTTGTPRAVMLSHGALVACTRMGVEMIEDRGGRHSSLSYLPLAHIAERGISVLAPAWCGYAIYFVEDATKVRQALTEIRPTIVLGVPRMWEKIQNALQERFDEAKGVKKFLLAWSRKVTMRKTSLMSSGQLTRSELTSSLAYKIAVKKILVALGLDRAESVISGAAPISVGTLKFFLSLGICIREAYGLSESAGVISFNRPGDTRLGTVGRPFDGVELKRAGDGEILAKGANMFSGYYKDPVASSETLVDGWLHTGDIGSIDSDGFLKITGRKKDLIITSGGKNISPVEIENLIKANDYVADCVVCGDGRKYLTALVVPDFEKMTSDKVESVRKFVDQHMEDVNRQLSQAQTIKKYVILERPLSIEQGELTPTLKVRRSGIQDSFRSEIEGMYE